MQDSHGEDVINMKWTAGLMIVTVLLSGLLLLNNTGQAEEYAWVLRQVLDEDGSKRVDANNSITPLIWRVEASYARGYANIRTIYQGNTDTIPKIPWINGSSITMKMGWSAPPSTIKSGQMVTLDLAVSASKTHQRPDGNGKVYAQVVAVETDGSVIGREIAQFQTADKRFMIETSSANNYRTFMEKVSATLPVGGQQGDKTAIRITASNGGSGLVSTTYIYQWSDSKTATKIDPYTPPTPPKNPPTAPTTPTKTGVTLHVTQLWGEVSYRNEAEDDDAYELVESDTVLGPGMRIRIKAGGGIRLISSELQAWTFEAQDDAVIRIPEVTEKSNLMMALGRTWVNAKTLIVDGTFDFYMTQTVAGIKGTTFILEEDGTTSTIKLLEGSIEAKPNNSPPVALTAGQSITVKDGKAAKVQQFSPAKELEGWSAESQQRIYAFLETEGIQLSDDIQTPKTYIYIGVLVVAALLAGGAALVLKRNR